MFDASKKWGQIGDNHCKKVHFLTNSIILPICYNPIKPIKTQVNKIPQKHLSNSHNPKAIPRVEKPSILRYCHR